MTFAEMQLGKNGLTNNFIQTLKSSFQTHENIRISVLKSARDPACKNSTSTPRNRSTPDLASLSLSSTPRNRSAGHDKEKIKQYSEEILDKLGKNYTAKLIGFKIILKKWRKEQR
ncbi:hypothetical protein A3K82_02235 [Candidatus Pacearchaeota archaeon RBG_19FT_COMBO_34_9]|nr:MAG: hypothetical protein A3K82_02235 [Candidatus Pacearchaeota archaeon RBG_19FT_COMBO_34_9]OGJ16100.1 MAG: hypothetical protein A3K74_02615 [Candidatus Pacearchaeota archaeon RBG_13_33_26]